MKASRVTVLTAITRTATLGFIGAEDSAVQRAASSNTVGSANGLETPSDMSITTREMKLSTPWISRAPRSVGSMRRVTMPAMPTTAIISRHPVTSRPSAEITCSEVRPSAEAGQNMTPSRSPERTWFCAAEMSLPHETMLVGRPRPRNDSVASATM